MYQYPIFDFTITTSELPGEVALALVFERCTKFCVDCHSPHLWWTHKNCLFSLVGVLERVKEELEKYPDISTILLMGGDTNGISKQELYDLMEALGELRPVGIYSGSDDENLLEELKHLRNVEYVKTGSFKNDLGGLETPGTNQRLYKKDYNILFDNSCVYVSRVPFWVDITEKFQFLAKLELIKKQEVN